MKTPQIVIATFLAAAALTNGCATSDNRPPPPSSSYYPGAAYGVVDAIEVTRGSGGGIGAGTIIGGVVGGVLGHQIGAGTGKDVATAAGVVGGAVVGHQMEKRNQQPDAYSVRVQLENGGYQTLVLQNIGDLRVGDRVRIENGNISRY